MPVTHKPLVTAFTLELRLVLRMSLLQIRSVKRLQRYTPD
jgi:hypothetical protein